MTVTYQGETFGETDSRIGARVLIAPPGQGADLGERAAGDYPMLSGTGFRGMVEPALIVTGEKDYTELFSPRGDWRGDAFTVSPGPKTRLMIADGEHMLGGISGFDAAETSDESPERVAIVRAMIWAYPRTALNLDGQAWPTRQAALTQVLPGRARIDAK